jgi:hypothetical protein
MKVDLEWFEVSRAALVGVSRNVEAMRKQCQNRSTVPDDWGIHILGALGECAFAKATNRYWNGSVNTFKRGGDVGRIQVRTRARHDHDLIVRPQDKSEDVFVLVTGGPSSFEIQGWCVGEEAKQDAFTANHGGYGEAYFVPAKSLRTPEQLVVGGEE